MRRRWWVLAVILASALLGLPATAGATATAPADDAVAGWIVKFRSDADRAVETNEVRESGGLVTEEYDAVFPGMAVQLTAAEAEDLRAQPTVEWVLPDTKVTVDGVEQITSPYLWGLDRVDQRSGKNGSYVYGPTGAGVTAYVIDSGIRADHVEFTGRIGAGATVFNDGRGASDCYGHGTHVSGTLGGTTYGVAKGVTIVPVKVLDCQGEGYDSQVIAGIDWIIATHAAGVPAVANISLGTGSAVNDAVRALVADGVTTAIAAGNRSVDACTRSPAQVREALTVAAIDPSESEASFSNYGSCVDLYAPGVDVLSASYASSTGAVVYKGTSMATPHVAGAAALILSARGYLDPATVAAEIVGKATPGVVHNARAPNLLLFTSGGSTRGPFPTTGTPHIDGAPAVGMLLSAAPGSWGPGAATFSYQWLRNGAQIAGATGESYTATAADIGTQLSVTVTASSSDYGPSSATSPATDPVAAAPAAGTYLAMSPARILDTRDGTGAAGPWQIGGTKSITVQVTGRGGVTPGASAVALTLTAVGGQSSGWLTAYPAGTPYPGVSNVNYPKDGTVAGLVVVPLPADGRLTLYNGSIGGVHVVADVAGYWTGGATSAAGTLGSVTPARVLDTRSSGPAVPALGSRTVSVAGVAGVPNDATAVVVNATAIGPSSAGWLGISPAGSGTPGASNLNFASGVTAANLTFAKLGNGGAVEVYNGSYSGLDVALDVFGYVRGGTATQPGTFVPISPTRIRDTRPGGVGPDGVITADPQVAGVPGNARAVVANVTVSAPSAAGWLTAYPAGLTRPGTSNVNFAPWQEISDLTMTRTGSNGDIQVWNASPGNSQVIADLQGYFR